MADQKIAYAASSPLTITLNGLATDPTKLTGRESILIDNTSNLFVDIKISGKITTGTSPTASKSIEVHAIAIADDTTWPDVFDGTDSAETITSVDVKTGLCRLVRYLPTDATSNRTYWFTGVSLLEVFGSTLPSKCVLWVTHDTGVNLHATAGNHAIWWKGVYFTG